ncbi:hydroxymethylbilane synthase [Reichenbachiella versicolor]|uniref:hydroxymethylbilane synthase n=1 Tax=Reichenbachiella versicolor TaxID=1821036 RepID=UPI000D6EA3CE|nr:hydroxymethylbilane synthase [Reichenbachiella versicolor]
MKIKIGTRGSKLALWQAYHVQDLLKEKGVDSEIIVIETKGDKVLNVSLSKIGSKGVFTEEIEDQLQSGDIDIAVHSAKDMQSKLPKGFEIIAFGKREKVHDILLSHKKIDLNSETLVLGTSSTRRLAFLKESYPAVKTVPIRGNLQTRIQKMKDGQCDALWLAYAGAHRMGYDDMIVHEFDPSEYIPAVGQGSIAIEVFETIAPEKKRVVREAINHEPSEKCLLAERAFLRKMDGGCSIPVFGRAVIKEEVLEITGGIISLDGSKKIIKTCSSTLNAVEKAGEIIGTNVLKAGGDKILEEIKSQNEE